jgi:phosphotriesterase-related protein
MSFEGMFLPSDNERVETIKEQIKRGNLEHILVSHDNCMKIKLTRWGGHGYAHILENIVPRLLCEGVTPEQIETILVENPKSFLGW